jgi:hypothetical protein
MWFKVGSYFLGYIFKLRKLLVGSLAVGLFGSALWFWLDVWHFEPLRLQNKEIVKLKKELRAEQGALALCKAKRKVSTFEAWRDGRVEVLRREIEEAKREEDSNNTLDVDGGWLF